MCGIVGVLQRGGKPIDAAIVWQMIDMQRHRGPDDEGMRGFSLRRGESVPYLRGQNRGEFEGVLGFNRLSILDLSTNGHQPMCSADGKTILIFNGEIYNAFDFVKELEARGVHLRSKSDTEILLYLYQEFGIQETLRRINGMFAFCIVDLRNRELHLVRDRLGIKPLYWVEVGEAILFASEIKAFLRWPNFKPHVDPARVDEYLAYRYIAGAGTVLCGVRSVPSGGRLRVTMEGVTAHQWWKIPDRSTQKVISFSDATQQFGHILERAVDRQMLSDVKVGCQLSGGIDSSLITLFAAKKAPKKLDAISIIFNNPEHSEEKWINLAAHKTGVKAHQFELKPEYFLANLERSTWHLDEPMNAPNTVGIYFLAECAKPFMTVLLSGEGADEMCGGYERFPMAAARNAVRPWRKLWQMSLSKTTRNALQKLFEWPGKDATEWYLRMTMFLPPERLLEVRPEAQIEHIVAQRREIFEQGKGDYASNCMKYEMQTYLVSLLTRQDKMTMAHSLENRVPILDNEVVDFVREIPGDYWVRGAWRRQRERSRNSKRLLKSVAQKYFDEQFVHRGKNGFHIPLAEYYAMPAFREMMHGRILPGIKKRRLFRAEMVEQWWKEAIAGGRIAHGFWNCLAFEIWAQAFLDWRG